MLCVGMTGHMTKFGRRMLGNQWFAVKSLSVLFLPIFLSSALIVMVSSEEKMRDGKKTRDDTPGWHMILPLHYC